jgi:hypothetical protein
MHRMSVASLPWWVGAAFALQALLVYVFAWLVNRRRTRGVTLELANKLAYLESQLTKVVDLEAGARRKFDEQFANISGYLGERDQWMALYHQQAGEHGTAQAMMLAERQVLIQQLQRAGVKPRVNKVVEQVANGFASTHVDAARRRGKPQPVGSELEGSEVSGES